MDSIHNLDKIQKLFSCYNPGYQPPEIFDTSLMKFCKVFYHIGDNLPDIMKLVKEREPVNIGMERLYSEYKLNKHFNLVVIMENVQKPLDIVPPNFIVYTPTLVLGYHQGNHILNVIGRF